MFETLPEFGVWGSGFGVQGSGFRGWGSGFGVQGLGFRVQGLGRGTGRSRVQGLGFGVWGLEGGASTQGCDLAWLFVVLQPLGLFSPENSPNSG